MFGSFPTHLLIVHISIKWRLGYHIEFISWMSFYFLWDIEIQWANLTTTQQRQNPSEKQSNKRSQIFPYHTIVAIRRLLSFNRIANSANYISSSGGPQMSSPLTAICGTFNYFLDQILSLLFYLLFLLCSR